LADHPDATAVFERVPIVRDILHVFYQRSNYQLAWDLLETHVFPMLQYDIYLQHVPTNNSSSSSSIISRRPTMTGREGAITTTTAAAPASTHLQILQDMIRTKVILFFWKAYQQCPLVNMMESLGSGITCTEHVAQFRQVILQLLKNRFRRIHSGSTVINNHHTMAFPMDTRLDAITNTLIRTTNLYANHQQVERDNEERSYYNTSLQLHRTSTRVLDDTYGMMVRVACMEHDVLVKLPLSSHTHSNTKRRSRGGGGGTASMMMTNSISSGPMYQQHSWFPPATNTGTTNSGIGSATAMDDDDDGSDTQENFVDSYDMNPEDMY
jgi:hypothetical protein